MVKKKGMYQGEQSGPLRRIVVLIRPIGKGDEFQAQKNIITAILKQIGGEINQKIRNIKDAYSYMVPYVDVDVENVYEGSKDDLERLLKNADGRYVRTIVYLDHDKVSIVEYLQRKQCLITHVLEVFIGKGENRWAAGNDFSNAVLFLKDERKIRFIVEDILLDVAVFNSGVVLPAYVLSSFKKKEKISQFKVDFAIENNHSTPYGPICKDQNYVALASLARDEDYQLNVENYSNILHKFSEKYSDPILKNPAKLKNFKISPYNGKHRRKVHRIFQGHKKYGQLPLNDIEKKLDRLQQGQYLLARVDRIPEKPPMVSTLLTVFGGESLRVGKWKIFSYEQEAFLKELFPFVKLFYFEI